MDQTEIRNGAERWLADFERALDTRDADILEELFLEESYLRDNGVLTWDLRQFHGRPAVVETLLALSEGIEPQNFRISDSWPEPSLLGEDDAAVVELFLDFETAAGIGVGVLNAVPDASSRYGFRARALYTRIEGLRDVDEPELHPRASGYTPSFRGETWGEHRTRTRQYQDRQPDVLIVGAGQAGLVVAAHLKQLGVDALIVDKHPRVGDNWRTRYDSLALHNPVEMNGFPFLPFPRDYPEYLPKDLYGDWLEVYARYLDLNVWSSTEFCGAQQDEETARWAATLLPAGGKQRILHPAHIILATGGIGGPPYVPALPGLASFTGKVLHSSQYSKADDVGAKSAIVVGVGTSGHDISLDLYDHGVKVTMIQRNPVIICDIVTANLAYAGYIDPDIPTDLVDIRYGIGLINPLREAASRQYQAMAKARDAELLAGLEAAGMRLSDGVNGQGWLDLFLREGGRYYLDKGASPVIVAGGIKVLQADELVEFVPNGAKLTDGTILEADLIVLATGYQNRKVDVAEQFGEEVAERVGDIARLDAEGEWATMWSQSGQPGLWINGGGINQIRPGSKILALLVKADLDGRISEAFRRPPKNALDQPTFLSAVRAD